MAQEKVLGDQLNIQDVAADIGNDPTAAAALQGGIDHTAIKNVGTNSHADLDNHIAGTDPALFHSANVTTFDSTIIGGTSIHVQQAIDFLHTDGIALREPSTTGNISGGVITKITSTTVDVTSGTGEIIDGYTDRGNPTKTDVSWLPVTSMVIDMPSAVGTQVLYVDDTNTVKQKSGALTSTERRQFIQLGFVYYHHGAVETITASGVFNNEIGNTLYDWIAYTDITNRSKGLGINPTTSTLKVWASSGTLLSPGTNVSVSLTNPNILDFPQVGDAVTALTFDSVYADGSTHVPTTTLIPNVYESAPGIATTLTGTEATIHYMFRTLGNTFFLQLGNTVYPSAKVARASLEKDNAGFVPFVTGGAVLSAQIYTENGAVDFTNANMAGINNINGVGIGAIEVNDYLSLNDVTSTTFVGQAGLIPTVNVGETGLEFSTVNWGTIAGTLSAQTDLQAALDTKFDGTFNIQINPAILLETDSSSNILSYTVGNNTPIGIVEQLRLGDTNTTISIGSTINGRLDFVNNVGIRALDDTGANPVNMLSRTNTFANVPVPYNNEVIVGDSGVATAIRDSGGFDPVVRMGAYGTTTDYKIFHEGNFTATLDSLSDVDTTGVTIGQVLTYSGSPGVWIPQTPSAGGGGSVDNPMTADLNTNGYSIVTAPVAGITKNIIIKTGDSSGTLREDFAGSVFITGGNSTTFDADGGSVVLTGGYSETGPGSIDLYGGNSSGNGAGNINLVPGKDISANNLHGSVVVHGPGVIPSVLPGAITLLGPGNQGSTILSAPTTLLDLTYIFPEVAGNPSDVLSTDGAGVLSWIAASGGGGGISNPLTSNLDTGGFRIETAAVSGSPPTSAQYINIYGGDNSSGNDANNYAGGINMYGGIGSNGNAGGSIYIVGGASDSYYGGPIYIGGGASDSYYSGAVTINGGSATAPGGYSGSVNISGGNAVDTPGGNIVLTPGTGSTTGVVQLAGDLDVGTNLIKSSAAVEITSGTKTSIDPKSNTIVLNSEAGVEVFAPSGITLSAGSGGSPAIDGSVNIWNGSGNPAKLTLHASSYSTIVSPSSTLTATTIFTLPPTYGNAGEVLTAQGGGDTAWAAAGGGSGNNWINANGGVNFDTPPTSATFSITIGNSSTSNYDSISIGNYTYSGSSSIAIGSGSSTLTGSPPVSAFYGIAIGGYTKATHNYSTSIGYKTFSGANSQLSLGALIINDANEFRTVIGYGGGIPFGQANGSQSLLSIFNDGKVELYGDEAQFIMPNYTTAEIAVPLPAVEGGLVWDSTAKSLTVYDGAAWTPVGGSGGGATTLNDLTDVDLVTVAPITNDDLSYNGTNWVPNTSNVTHRLDTTIHFTSITGLSDVVLTSPSAAEILTYDGANWVNQPPVISTPTFISNPASDTTIYTDQTTNKLTFSVGAITNGAAKFNALIFDATQFTLEFATAPGTNTIGSVINLTAGRGKGSSSGGDINLDGGQGGVTGKGGDVILTGGLGDGPPGGGAVSLYGGNTTVDTSDGGPINIIAGQSGGSGAGGAITITGGASGVSGGNAGNVTISGGPSTASNGLDAGSLTLQGGNSTVGIGGNITVAAGTSAANYTSANVNITGANSSSNIAAGDITIRAGDMVNPGQQLGGDVFINAGTGGGGNTGGKVIITAGQGGPTNGSGNDVEIRGGTLVGSGTNGEVAFYTGTTQRMRLENDGTVTINTTSTPGGTANRMYNVSGNLFWNGVQLDAAAGGASQLNDLSDVLITAPAPSEVLQYNGTNWVDVLLPAASVKNTPAANISATTVQAAIDELDSKKAPYSSPSFTGYPRLPSYTVANKGGASTAGAIIYVSDADGGVGTICFANGLDWIDIRTGNPVSTGSTP